MAVDLQLNDVLDFAFSRRNFVRGSVAGGAVVLATATGIGQAFAQQLTDVDILQFALTLEHLTARMYADMRATNLLTGKDSTTVESFGAHEAAHVQAISDTLVKLGATPVQAKASYNLPSFDSREAILNFAKLVEDVSVGAYQGAAGAIRDKAILAAAGSIVQVEARHAAIINLLLGLDPVPLPTTAGLTLDEVNSKVGPLLGT